jgi:hypothetical protein
VDLATIACGALIAAAAWGALAFGAVYPWAYWPLVIVAVGVAAAGLVSRAPVGWRQLDLSSTSLALAVFLAAATVQIVPLPLPAVRAISPEAPSIIAQRNLTAQLELKTTRPLSIDPAGSLRGLAVVASLAGLVVGAAKLLSVTGAIGVARAIAVLGVLLALIGIVQRPLFTGKIYGFWSPLQGGSPFGPFVNKNHFAGWMLMAVPVTLGLLYSEISRGMRRVRPGLREKVLWLSSPDASRLLLLAGAAGIMTLSLILTMSRSGMTAGALGIGAVVLASRRYRARGKRIAAVAIVSVPLVLAVGWAGAGTIASRFASGSVLDVNGRTHLWGDAIDIVRRYPVAGTGLNTYSVAMLFYQRFNPSVHYSQAHNDYLQLAVEGGLLLALPAAICLTVFARAVRRRFASEPSSTTYWVRRGAVAGLVAVALQEIVEFSLQMPGNAFLFAVLCAIALHRPPTRRP